MLDVLIVESSNIRAEGLQRLLESQLDIRVLALATKSDQALRLLARHKPALVLVSVELTPLNGYQLACEIMSHFPVPLILMKAGAETELQHGDTIRALQTGAMALSVYPEPSSVKGHELTTLNLFEQLRSLAQVRTLRQYRRGLRGAGYRTLTNASKIGIVAIAASTGGPNALAFLLSRLPANFPCPILIVQHMTSGFTEGFARWLDTMTPLKVRMALAGERPVPGNVYMADSSHHLELSPNQTLLLSSTPAVDGFRPSANRLFRSVAEAWGSRALTIVLTGMGRDGTDGLRAVKERGGFVVAQDKGSSVIHGMPGAAIEAGVVDKVLSLEGISSHLLELVGVPRRLG